MRNALESFDHEIERLDASLTSIRDGKFLKVLVREEVRQDKDWIIRLRSLPESPETYYLMELLASHDFQTALQNYLDLEDLRRKLASWHVSFDAFDDMIGLRRQYYEPQLPGVDAEFRDLDSRMRLRLEQHELLEKRLQGMLVAAAARFSRDGRRAPDGRRDWPSSRRASRATRARAADELRRRIARLQGVITYTLRTEYHGRLDVFARHLRRPRATRSRCCAPSTSSSCERGRRPCTVTRATTRRSAGCARASARRSAR